MKTRAILKKFKESRFAYLSLLGIIIAIFLAQAFTYAHRLPSRVDEGSFLVKGYYFVSGQYRPFEDYGPWTNNMPLAYLIPGVPQVLFGPGLMVGRYFAIFISLLALVGLWSVSNRLFGKWWAIFLVAAISLSPAWIATNVQAVSQVLVMCQVSWLLYFLLGEERRDWQLALSALLSASVTLTRQNMIFMMAFVFLYCWWMFGFKKALLALVVEAVPFIVVHALYYPKIMHLWYTWLPGSIKHLFNVGIIQGGGKQVWRPDGDLVDRISSFFLTMRYYFIPLFGAFITFPMLFKRKNWRSRSNYRMVVSLSALFYILFFMHAWASLTKNYCIFCFSNYVDFFLPIAAIITVFALQTIIEDEKKLSFLIPLLLLLILVPGLFFTTTDTVGRSILALPVPRIKHGTFAGGTTMLWEIFRNRFGFEFDQTLLLIPPVFGFALFVLLISIIWITYRVGNQSGIGFSSYFLSIIFIVALILTPTNILGGYPDQNVCNGNALSAYEDAGKQLDISIPDEASIYWGSGSLVTPLLYISDKGIQPLQLNGIYNKRIDGDRSILERDGYYNVESIREWRDNADYILVQKKNMVEFWGNYLEPELYDEIGVTVPIDPCDANSSIKIFRKK